MLLMKAGVFPGLSLDNEDTVDADLLLSFMSLGSKKTKEINILFHGFFGQPYWNLKVMSGLWNEFCGMEFDYTGLMLLLSRDL